MYSLGLIHNTIAGIAAGALVGTYCKCEIEVRYKLYWYKNWYGVVKARFSLLGLVYNYYYTGSGGRTYTGVYDVQTQIIWSFDSRELVNGWVPLPSTLDLAAVKKESQYPTWVPNAWTGWIDP